jgi:hypothetical protein
MWTSRERQKLNAINDQDHAGKQISNRSSRFGDQRLGVRKSAFMFQAAHLSRHILYSLKDQDHDFRHAR